MLMYNDKTVVMHPTFVDSDNEGMSSRGDKPAVTVNQVSHIFCCSKRCCGDCERLCTQKHKYIWISGTEKDRELLHSDTMRVLLVIMSPTKAHTHTHPFKNTLPLMCMCCFSLGLLKTENHSTSPLTQTLKNKWKHSPYPPMCCAPPFLHNFCRLCATTTLSKCKSSRNPSMCIVNIKVYISTQQQDGQNWVWHLKCIFE